jgi:RimJ/RimL family protein N-acetyltransferase
MKPMGSSIWPLFDLELRTPRLTLRVPQDTDLPGLLDAVDAGIHEPDEMPFAMAWTDQEPAVRRISTVQHHWAKRAAWQPEHWDLMLAAFVEDRPIGIQHMSGKDFPLLRTVDTGSWLTRAEQGKGYGKEMRTAVLHLAFEELGAVCAESGAYTDNYSSAGVSVALGYRENGLAWHAPRGEAKQAVRYLLTVEDWRSRPPYCEVSVSGLDLASFGLAG